MNGHWRPSSLTGPPGMKSQRWNWMLAVTPRELAYYAETPKEDWLADAYAWRYQRLPESERTGLPAPEKEPETFSFPHDSFPVLAAGADSGQLNLIRVADPGESFDPGSDRDPTAKAAAAFSAKLWEADSPQPPPRLAWVEPMNFAVGNETGDGVGTGASFDGASVGLSAFILSALHGMHLDGWPDDICATGCWRDDRLAPVASGTLPKKLEAAKSWGFSRVFLVQGQEGLGESGWEAGQCVFLPEDPVEALLIILATLFGDKQDDNGAVDKILSRALMHLDSRLIRNHPNVTNFTASSALASRYQHMNLPWTRFMAYDMQSRAALHSGDTDRAKDFYDLAIKSLPPKPWTNSALVPYITFVIRAHATIIAIDQGRLGDAEPEHQGLTDAIGEIESRCDEMEYMLAAANMYSANSQRLRFLGRIEGNLELLDSSWEGLARFSSVARGLALHGVQEKKSGNDGERRRHNYMIDTLTDIACIAGDVPEKYRGTSKLLWPSLAEGPASSLPAAILVPGESAEWSAYDISAWLRWLHLFGDPVPPEKVAEALTVAEKGMAFDRGTGTGVWFYPWTTVAETVLRFGLGDETCDERARKILGSASYMLKPASGILALLAMRDATLLDLDPEAYLPEPDSHPTSKLHELGLRLLALHHAGRPLRDTTPY